MAVMIIKVAEAEYSYNIFFVYYILIIRDLSHKELFITRYTTTVFTWLYFDFPLPMSAPYKFLYQILD